MQPSRSFAHRVQTETRLYIKQMVAHEAALVFIVVGAVLGGGCCLKITVLWVRKWLRGRRNNLGLGSALKEVVLQELDNFREPMGGWDRTRQLGPGHRR